MIDLTLDWEWILNLERNLILRHLVGDKLSGSCTKNRNCLVKACCCCHICSTINHPRMSHVTLI
jgi:hypothetical protein